MSKIRKNYPAKFKKQVVLAVLQEDVPISELSSRFGVHASVIQRWKKEALASIEDGFSGKLEKHQHNTETHIKELHAKIGQLTVERDFLADASRRLGLGVEKNLSMLNYKKK